MREVFQDLGSVVQVTATGLLAVILLLLLRAWLAGNLVTKRELDYRDQLYEARLADKDARIEEKTQEAAEWRRAHETSETARELLNAQNRDLASAFGTFEHFFSEIRSVVARKAGGRDVR
jgi:hypothetical protein